MCEFVSTAMKSLWLSISLILPSIAVAQSGSQHCPFKLPFDFSIQVHGIFHNTNELGGNDTSISTFSTGWTLDTPENSFSVHGDTISASYSEPYQSGSFFMEFDSSTQTISYLSIGSEEEVYDYQSGQVMGATTFGVELSIFMYDSVSIFTTDSSLSHHDADASYNQWQQNSSVFHDGYSSTLFSVSAISLSGNLRPVTLNVSTPLISSSQTVSLSYNTEERQFLFPFSSRQRTLELYNLLGSKVESFEIPPGQSEISIPQLPSGLYFVRMDGAILKVAVP